MVKYLALLLLVCTLISCESGQSGSSGTEGIITYNIAFPNVPPESMMNSLLPEEVITHFKENKSRTTMKAGMFGFNVESTYITDAEKKEVVILINLYGKKYATIKTANDIQPESISPYKIIPQSKKVTIAGHTCKKALAIDISANDTFSICYAKDIILEDMYWNTPYKNINAPLLEYKIDQEDMMMELKANKVQFTEVADSLFQIPKDYKIVTEEQYDEIIKELPFLEL